MSILSRPLRPSSTASDVAVRRYVEELRRHAEPDPLFRRRLRGTVVNRFVAVQEGVLAPRAVRQASRMGTLGRACLYASFAMAVSVGGAMAASERAVPGELLYPLKRSIESLRLDVLPAQYHDELVAEALSARIMEIAALLDSGQVALAASLSDDIRESYEQLVALKDSQGLTRGLRQMHLAQLDAMVGRLPPAARTVVDRAMDGSPAAGRVPQLGPNAELGPQGRAQDKRRHGLSGQGGPSGHKDNEQAELDRAPKPSPKGERAPKRPSSPEEPAAIPDAP